MTVLTLRYIKGDFVVTASDIAPMKFKSRREARDWCDAPSGVPDNRGLAEASRCCCVQRHRDLVAGRSPGEGAQETWPYAMTGKAPGAPLNPGPPTSVLRLEARGGSLRADTAG
jgi:hypothetical protein